MQSKIIKLDQSIKFNPEEPALYSNEVVADPARIA